ncbi:MAG TPA: energy-coupling factor transporter transmembrane component T [Anaerolineales bacterium]|nr:energy-coupling factor transporter transmembrane component T [Anaerolineales bacterium]
MNDFSLYVARDSGLHKLHPLTKGIYVLFVLVAGFTLPGPWTSYFVVAFGILPLAAWGKVLGIHLRSVWRVTWPFALSVLLIQGLFWGHGEDLVSLGPLALKKEGVAFAFISIGRILLVMSSFILFSLTTRPDMLMISLKQAGFPGSIAYIFVTTLQIIPRFQSRAQTVLDAQRSRGLETEGNLLVRSRALVPLVVPLVLGSLVDVEERAIAIEARAFNSNHKETSVVEIPDSLLQKRIRAVLTAGAALLVVAGFAWRLLS